MSTLKVNTLQTNSGSGFNIDSPLESIPSIDVTGSASIGGGINVTGVSTFGNTVVGGGTTQLVVTGDARFTGITSFNDIVIDGTVGAGTSTFVVTSTGSVGIGTTNPGAKLDVSGDIRLSAVDAEIEFNDGGARLKGRTNALSIHTGSGLDSELSEQVRINNTGVGIGTNNPTVALQLSSNARISNLNGNINFGTTAGAAATVAQFYHFNGNGSDLRIKATRNTAGSDWTTASTKILQVTDVTEQGYIEFNPNGATFGMAFGQGSTEWARFLSSGNVGIGTVDPQRGLHINAGFRYTNRLANSTQTALHINTTTGDIAPTASSLRYKRNIEDYTKGLETLMQLRPVSFNFLEDDLPNCGLIAEEVDALNLPEFIRYDEEDLPISIPYDNLAALYVNAIKQLKQENDSLREELNLIKAHLGL